MAAETAIEWTDATVNFWWGCTKVGPGCDNCYAETWAKRTGGDLWGVGAPRRKIKGAVALIHRLDNDYSWWAADHHIGQMHATPTRRVFIQSMSDLFDTEVPVEWFAEAWDKIKRCDRLAIQIVTKRISVVEKRLASIGATIWPSHAGLMISVVNQDEANRDVPRLLALKAKLGIPWVGLSMEPLLGPVELRAIPIPDDLAFDCTSVSLDALTGYHRGVPRLSGLGIRSLPAILPGLDWVVVGGESGPGARPMHPAWARRLRDQCAVAGVPFLFKQWGQWAPVCAIDLDGMAEELYRPMLVRHRPEGPRRCKVSQCVLHADGTRFAMNEWSATEHVSGRTPYQADDEVGFRVARLSWRRMR